MKLTRPFIVAAALAAALAGAALAGVVAHKSATVKTISVTEKEFHITLATRKGTAGPVRFSIKNTGKLSHALAISGPGVKLKKTHLIKPGKTAILAVTLKAGKYTIWCPVPGHAAQGMKTSVDRAGRRRCRQHDDDDHAGHDHERCGLGLTGPLHGTPDATAGSPIPPSLYLGFAVASIGGPARAGRDLRARRGRHAFRGICSPSSASRSTRCRSPSGCATARRSSRPAASPRSSKQRSGGALALVQAAIWAFSYFLYLPYTVTDIVYEMLADVFPGIEPWRWLIEIVLP